jgi:hypothetical protein
MGDYYGALPEGHSRKLNLFGGSCAHSGRAQARPAERKDNSNVNLQKLSLIFGAGCFGGLVKGLVAAASAGIGLNAALGVTMTPSLTTAWVYQHVVWGGLWAFLFLIPLKGSYYYRGAVFSLGQTSIQLFVILPKMGKGLLGLQFGALTPILILVFGIIWGLATGFWLKLVSES